jgi:hypothetical protein
VADGGDKDDVEAFAKGSGEHVPGAGRDAIGKIGLADVFLRERNDFRQVEDFRVESAVRADEGNGISSGAPPRTSMRRKVEWAFVTALTTAVARSLALRSIAAMKEMTPSAVRARWATAVPALTASVSIVQVCQRLAVWRRAGRALSGEPVTKKRAVVGAL